MVDPECFKNHIEGMLPQDYKLEFLGDHKYYDKVRKELDLKRSSY